MMQGDMNNEQIIIGAESRENLADEAWDAMVHTPILHPGKLPYDFYEWLVIPPQPGYKFEMNAAEWIRQVQYNNTIQHLWDDVISFRWEHPEDSINKLGLLTDKVRFVVPLYLAIDLDSFTPQEANEIHQQAISLINLVAFNQLRLGGTDKSGWVMTYSYRNFLSKLTIGKSRKSKKGISAEIYEQSLKERAETILNILGLHGIQEFLTQHEPHLLGYINYIDERFNPKGADRRVPQTYEILHKIAVMLFIMERDRLVKILPKKGSLVWREK